MHPLLIFMLTASVMESGKASVWHLSIRPSICLSPGGRTNAASVCLVPAVREPVHFVNQ